MDQALRSAYLQRIGVASPPPQPDAAALRDLQLAHLRTVPFENLSIHLGEPVVLTEEALAAKIVQRRRGGFCYELNGAFAALLTALGYRVTLLAARVYGEARLGPVFDHLALRVDTPQPWLVDVGFGAFSHHPLRLDRTGPQSDPGGSFEIRPEEYGDLTVLLDGKPQYRLETRPRQLADFEPTCWWQCTSPSSHFTTSLTCSRLTETGRVTLSGRKLIRTVHGDREELKLPDAAAVLASYRDEFGISLDREPPDPRRRREPLPPPGDGAPRGRPQSTESTESGESGESGEYGESGESTEFTESTE